MKARTHKRRTAEQWLKLLDDYVASGLTGIEYCKRHDIGLKGFYRAKTVYGKAVERKGFIKVKSEQPEWSSLSNTININFPHARLSLSSDVSAKWVADLLKYTVQ